MDKQEWDELHGSDGSLTADLEYALHQNQRDMISGVESRPEIETKIQDIRIALGALYASKAGKT